MSQVSEMLAEAKKLIESPEKWIKGQMCDGDCFCADGALIAVVGYTEETFFQSYHKLKHVVEQKGFNSIPWFNDEPATTHGDVMEVFDLAIERSKL